MRSLEPTSENDMTDEISEALSDAVNDGDGYPRPKALQYYLEQRGLKIVRALPDDPVSGERTDTQLACGHPGALGVLNIESKVVSCELCEARDELRDALAIEIDLGGKLRARDAEIATLREEIAALRGAAKPSQAEVPQFVKDAIRGAQVAPDEIG